MIQRQSHNQYKIITHFLYGFVNLFKNTTMKYTLRLELMVYTIISKFFIFILDIGG